MLSLEKIKELTATAQTRYDELAAEIAAKHQVSITGDLEEIKANITSLKVSREKNADAAELTKAIDTRINELVELLQAGEQLEKLQKDIEVMERTGKTPAQVPPGASLSSRSLA